MIRTEKRFSCKNKGGKTMKKKIAGLALAAMMMLTAAPAAANELSFAPAAEMTAAAADNCGKCTSYVQEIAELVNRERAANGLTALKLSPVMSEAANVRAKEIQTAFSHTRPDGRSCFTALSEAGVKYTYAAENIAYGQKTPAEVMKGWMNSSGHRANILSKNAQYIGIGVQYKNGVYYWTQFFAAGNNISGQTVTTTAKPAVTTKATQKTTAKVTKKTTAKTTQKTTAKTTTKAAATKKTACKQITIPVCIGGSCKNATAFTCFDGLNSLLCAVSGKCK